MKQHKHDRSSKTRAARRATRRPAQNSNAATVAALIDTMECIAPTWTAAEWDNVGLLVGDPGWPAGRVLLTIDLTPPVLDEAIAGRYDAIVAYHPPIFRPTKRMLVERASSEGLAAEALARRIAIYSPHTALDAAPGGTNETIAALCGLRGVVPFQAARPPSREFKLVTFVPREHGEGLPMERSEVGRDARHTPGPKPHTPSPAPSSLLERVAEALFAAGAGRIGQYEKCSFRSPGCGTFFGGDDTNPAVGRRGRLQHVEEVRLEVVVPVGRIADVVAALRAAHPYETPAFDLYPLESAPDPAIGQGRIGAFTRKTTLAALARSLSRRLSAGSTAIIGRPSTRLHHALVCVGAAGSLPFEIAGRPCGPGDVVITGEIRHHDALRYHRLGACAIVLGHWASERPVLMPLAANLRRLLQGAAIVVSVRDCDPFGSP